MTRRMMIVGGVGAVFTLAGASVWWETAARSQPDPEPAPAPAPEPVEHAPPAEDEIPVEKLPAVVAAAVHKLFPKVTFDSVSTYTDEKKVLHYEVFFKHNKGEYEVTVTEKGKVIEVAREIEFKDLPKAVAAAVKAKYPKATIGEVSELTEPDVKGKHYHVELTTAGGKDVELTYTPDGKLVHEESD